MKKKEIFVLLAMAKELWCVGRVAVLASCISHTVHASTVEEGARPNAQNAEEKNNVAASKRLKS